MSATVQFREKDEACGDVSLLSAAVEACPESLAIIESGRVLFRNRAFAEMFGHCDATDVQGRILAEFVPEVPARISSEGTNGNETRDCGHPVCEFSSTRKDGARVHIETSCTAFRVNGRNLLVLSARDISQHKQVERQLQESQKMEAMGRLVGGVAHDFNNLLTGIMLYCGLLSAGLNGNRRLQHHADEIRKAGEHGAGLIRQLLAAARQQVIEPVTLSWNEVISGTRNLLAQLIGEDIELVTVLAEDLGYVKMDPAQAGQILLNLVLNARDAMSEGGRITLATRNAGDSLPSLNHHQPFLAACVEFTVTDNGCGMDAETRSHMFEAFFTSKKPGQGTGLGLVTVQSIVEQAGGTIAVESAPGRGTQVRVRLPQVHQEAAQKSNGKKRDQP
jgi:two-component system cell cycle sensor histidine kinase/response regulator CckA